MAGWKKYLKKIWMWQPDMRFLAAVSVIVLLALLVPLLRIAGYCVPWYDDYNYGRFAKEFLKQEHSFRSAMEGALYCVKTSWYAWQGTFSSVFMMSVVPIIWNEGWYFLGLSFLMLILPASVLVLGKVLVRDVLKADRASGIFLSVLTAVMALEMVHLSREGLFWYNSGVHYVGMHSFLLLFIAGMARLLSGCGKIRTGILLLLSLVGAVLASGANFVTTLQGLLVILSLVGLGIVLKRKNTLLLLPAVCVYGYGFYKNVSAPGNAKRALSYVGWGLEAPQAILQSFVEAFAHLWEFTGWMTVLLLVMAVPAIWRMAGRTSFRFPLPGLVLLWSFCLYAAGYTPSLYSLGHGGLGRTLNAVKITFQILLVLNEVYLLGWLRGALERRGRKAWNGECCWWFYGGVCAVMLAVFLQMPGYAQEGRYSSWGAYRFVHSGEAYNFHQEYLERVEVLENSGPDVTVKPYAWQPWLICVGDLSDNPAAEENVAMARWYGKDSITCVPVEAGE